MQGFTIAGFIFLGILIGGVGGFIWGTIRERKGMNKKKRKVKESKTDEYANLGAGYGQHAHGIPCSYYFKK